MIDAGFSAGVITADLLNAALALQPRYIMAMDQGFESGPRRLHGQSGMDP